MHGRANFLQMTGLNAPKPTEFLRRAALDGKSHAWYSIWGALKAPDIL
jgi:hypothetical protein